MANDNPMQKNGIGEGLPSRNEVRGDYPGITRENGAPVINNQDTMTAGPRGPQVVQDAWLLEKHAHFNREVIPERRMHAKGSGAFGEFVVTKDITKYTKAKIFALVGQKTKLFIASPPWPGSGALPMRSGTSAVSPLNSTPNKGTGIW